MDTLYRFDGSGAPHPPIPAFDVAAGRVHRVGRPHFDTAGKEVIRLLRRRPPGQPARPFDSPVACGSFVDILASGWGRVRLGRLFRSGYRLPRGAAEGLERHLGRCLASFRPDAPLVAYPHPAMITIAVEAALATDCPVVLYHLDPHMDDRLLALVIRERVADAVGHRRCAVEVVWPYDQGPVDVPVGDAC